MNADKQPDRKPHILESASESAGKRTLIQATLASGSSLSSHYHTQIEETFNILEVRLLSAVPAIRC
jgi:hypothetical protein